MRRSRQAKPGQVVAPFQNGDQPALGVFASDAQHDPGEVGKVVIRQQKCPSGSSLRESNPAEIMTNSGLNAFAAGTSLS